MINARAVSLNQKPWFIFSSTAYIQSFSGKIFNSTTILFQTNYFILACKMF